MSSFTDVRAALRSCSLNTSHPTLVTSEKRRITSVIKSMLVSNGLTIILQLVSVPILLLSWGAMKYGEWLILFTIPSYISLTDFGIITTANNRIEALTARGRYAAACRSYLNSIILLVAIVGSIAALTIVIFSIFFEKISGVFTEISAIELLPIISLLILDTSLTLISNHNSALFRTIGKFNLTVNWQAIARVMPQIALCVAAYTGHGVLQSICIMAATRLLAMSAMFIHIHKTVKWINRRWMRLQGEEIKSLSKNALSYLPIPLSNIFQLHVSLMIVAATTNPLTVAAYATMRTFTRLIPQLVAIAGRSYWSEITQASARKDKKRILHIRSKILKSTLISAAVFCAGYSLFGLNFYSLWTGNSLNISQGLFFALLIHATAISLYYSTEVIIIATNKFKKYTALFLTLTVLQIIIGILLIPYFGVEALPTTGAVFSLATFAYIVSATQKDKSAARQ